MIAIAHDKMKAARYLVNNLAVKSLGFTDQFGRNALHYMALCGRPWVPIWRNITLKLPQTWNLTDKYGDKPTDIVRSKGSEGCGYKALFDYVVNQAIPSAVLDLDDESIERVKADIQENAEETTNIKIVCIGHEGVGKTCLVLNLLGETIDLQTLRSTNLADLFIRRLLLDMANRAKIVGPTADAIMLGRLKLLVNNMKIKEDLPPPCPVRKETTTTSDTADPERKVKTSVFPRKTQAADVRPVVQQREQDVDREVKRPFFRRKTQYPVREVKPSLLPRTTQEGEDQFSGCQQLIIDAIINDGTDYMYKSKAFVTMYDFGGEEIFYNAHHALMTSDGIYLLVFNVAMCLNPGDEQEGLNRIVMWLESIAMYAISGHQSSSGIPPVLLIGSHMDLLKGTDEEKHRQFESVIEKVKSVQGIAEIFQNHIKGIFPIANLNDSNRNHDVIEKIWDTIVKVAPLQSQWNKHIPGKWLVLEYELLQKKELGHKFMTIDDLMELNSKLVMPLTSVVDVKLCLRYLHMTGVIFSFDLGSDSPIIVLDPQYVIDAFKCLITLAKYVEDLGTEGKALWKEYEKSGKLPLELLVILLKQQPDKQFLNYVEKLTTTMERLGLLVKPLPKDENDSVDFCIVPNMLTEANAEKMQYIMADPSTTKSCTLCVQFHKRFIPKAIWDKMIAACIHRFQPLDIPDQESPVHCFRGSIAVAVNCLWNLMVDCKGNVMKLTLFKMLTEHQATPGAGNAVRLMLEDVLQQILSMNQQSHLKFQYYLHGDYKVREGDVAVQARRFLKVSSLECSLADADGRKSMTITRNDYDVWFQNNPQNRESIASGSKREIRPTHRQLGRIAKLIYGAHHMFFIELDLTDACITQTRNCCGHMAFRSQITRLFIKWMNICPNPNLDQIAAAMQLHGMDSNTLFTELDNLEEDILCEEFALPEVNLLLTPNPDEIEKIAAFVDDSYFNLFLELDLSESEIIQAEINHRSGGIKVVFENLLHSWVKKSGRDATINRVMLAMKECNMPIYELAQELA